jgi:peptidoglycan/LPS O-acetylase OafA/YrhL
MTDRKTNPRYRPDLDGLRAVAILAVVSFHVGMPFGSGGFVGVDIFFVISGFLISSIIYRQMDGGSFSFRSFYERRAKRILPTLVTVLFATYVPAIVLLSARELRSFSAQALTALGCASNIFFWHSTGYFDAHAELKPLLMTWSLGVEEQFYLLFPLLVVVLYRRGRRTLFLTIFLLSAASFAFSIFQTARHPEAAFYMLPSRWWELGVGTLLGAYRLEHGNQTNQRRRPQLLKELSAGIGFVVLLASFFLLRPTAPFPGFSAAPCVIATAALIFTEGSWVNRNILAIRPMVAIGLVSYSWYLWHWPLLAFARISADGILPLRSGLLIALLSLLLAVGTYFVVEQPFRKAPSRAFILWRYAALSLSMAIPPIIVIRIHGWPGRYPVANQIEAAARPPIYNPCVNLDNNSLIPQGPPCVPPSGADRPILAIMGDSHAASLARYLAEEARSRGWQVAQYTKVSCPPTGAVGVHSTAMPSLSYGCPQFYSAADRAIVDNPAVRTVLITGLWTDWVDPRYPDRHYNPPGKDIAGRIPQEQNYKNLQTGVDTVVRQFVHRGKRVIIAMDVPPAPFDPLLRALSTQIPARHMVERLITGGARGGGSFQHVPDVDERKVANILKSIAERDGADYINLSEAMCVESRCQYERDGIPLYFDRGHLTKAGAQYALRNTNLFMWRFHSVEPSVPPLTAGSVKPASLDLRDIPR